MARDTNTEREVTTDRDRIEKWAEEHDAAPVRHERGGREVIDILPRSEQRGSHEELSWDEFHDRIQRDDHVVVHREEERRPFEVTDQRDLLGRSRIDDDVRERLVAGETVTATITETTVIEETIVEEATLESELVDRTTVEESFVDAELITREVGDCEVTEVEGMDSITDEAMLEAGYEGDDSVKVEVEVDEGWTVTKEVLDRLTIETRIVDTDATEAIETEEFKENIDVEGIQESILEGELLTSEEKATDVIDSGAVESEFREGETVETYLMERKTVEEEVSVRKEFTGDLTGGRTTAADVISRETIETEVAADEDLDVMAVGGETAAESETDTEPMVGADAEGGMEEPMVGDHPVPTEADEGKTVVDSTGEKVGMVVEVEADTVYVDPHPSLTDRIKQVLDWGGRDEDAYPLQADHIARITDDEVQLTVEEEEDR